MNVLINTIVRLIRNQRNNLNANITLFLTQSIEYDFYNKRNKDHIEECNFIYQFLTRYELVKIFLYKINQKQKNNSNHKCHPLISKKIKSIAQVYQKIEVLIFHNGKKQIILSSKRSEHKQRNKFGRIANNRRQNFYQKNSNQEKHNKEVKQQQIHFLRNVNKQQHYKKRKGKIQIYKVAHQLLCVTYNKNKIKSFKIIRKVLLSKITLRNLSKINMLRILVILSVECQKMFDLYFQLIFILTEKFRNIIQDMFKKYYLINMFFCILLKNICYKSIIQVIYQNMQHANEQLTKIQQQLQQSLKKFQVLHKKTTQQSSSLYHNSRLVIPLFTKIMTDNTKSLYFLLLFLSDEDILSIGATCKTVYKFIYSPLGYRILNTLRPLTITIIKKQQLYQFSQNTLQNLCSDRSLVNLDEDDKVALILTMQTNLIATKQKINELDQSIYHYQLKCDEMLNDISFVGGQRDDELKIIGHLQDQIQKMDQVLKQSQLNLKKLKDEQQKILLERNTKLVVLQSQKSKLQHHKQLLIKKVKSQQKQKEEGMTYSRQVTRVMNKLNKIIGNQK